MQSASQVVSTALIAGAAVFTATPATSYAASACDDARVDTVACQREKAAAAAEKRDGSLVTRGEEKYRANALRRCERQPEGAARESCRQRVLGIGNTTTTGSVKGGGTLSTNEITLPPGSSAN